MPLNSFHPAVGDWFRRQFGQPTEVQAQAWPAIQCGQSTLIAAPTGSGKTLAAFLAAVNDLVCEGLAQGLRDETHVLYVSPLKALSNDIQKNLQQPLNGIRDALLEHGLADVDIRAMVRTGDTSQGERLRMRKQAPHILVTTPESLYILLTSDSGRELLQHVRSVIVDEIHALAGNKRGAHLMLSLERLNALCLQHHNSVPVRIGLSATQKPIETMARYLIGDESRSCTIIDTGHVRERDLALEVPLSPLEAVMANEVWEEIYDRLEQLIQQHRTTLIFVNTRRLAERAARHLAERLGEDAVTSHHGSLAKGHRLDAEQRLKAGQLRALVATASLELGIDIGDVDLVCQLGSPRAIATFLQRVGRSGHAVGALPKGRLFPLTRDDLVECAAMLQAVQQDELDRIIMPTAPLDVLAQQIVAEVAGREWREEELYQTLKRAHPYHLLTQQQFTDVVRMLADGFSTRRGRRGAYLHRDVVNGRLRARRGARLVAVMNGGAIPDQFDYDVILQPEGYSIGNLNEDFAFESLPGDIFQLGNTSYRMLKIEQGRVYVEDAHGQPPNIPFWFGEAPGRTDELSLAVSNLRAQVDQLLEQGPEKALQWLTDELRLPAAAASQLHDYLAAAKAALGTLPDQDTIVFERFFDETGDMHFVIHSCFGSRLNRAWGLALRKRFCRKFNFELQAAATENNVILSLGPTHSFPLAEVANYLNPQTVREILIQALLAAPMFGTRWRWNANIALAVPRNRNGKRVPAQFQRNDAEDLVAVLFPDQLACFENLSGDREVPDHPLVEQTINDCLHELMDIDGLIQLLQRITRQQINLLARDLTTPSPLAQEILNANPYAFLDDAPAEERRTLAVQQRRLYSPNKGDPQSAADIGHLDTDAINTVCAEAWPEARDADELHDALVVLGFLTESECTSNYDSDRWKTLLQQLARQQRATLLNITTGEKLWVAAERLAQLQKLFPDAAMTPAIVAVQENASRIKEADQALIDIIRSRLEGLGPCTATTLGKPLGFAPERINLALLALEQEGFVIQGHFRPGIDQTQWCERRLLARIHRYTLKRLRSEIEPASAADFMRYLFQWQGVTDKGDGQEALAGILAQLEGLPLPAAAWEKEVLPARLDLHLPQWLDNLCTSGRFVWLRLTPNKDIDKEKARKLTPVRITPTCLIPRQHLTAWRGQNNDAGNVKNALSTDGKKLMQLLQQNGAQFFDDLVHASGLLRTQVENALGELVSLGLITSDSFAGLRALITPTSKKPPFAGQLRRRRPAMTSIEEAGRWSLLPQAHNKVNQQSLAPDTQSLSTEQVEHIARGLLRRYGVVFRKLLEREVQLPPWRDLLYVYRRLEARGEIRGGRFVAGFSGEQFALPEAVTSLRNMRNQTPRGDMVSISAVDPLNLTSIITPGERITAVMSNRILYRDGVPVAASIKDKVTFLKQIDEENQWEARNLLLHSSKHGHYLPAPAQQV
jgi:ATP-dependent Lhr-like helicase